METIESLDSEMNDKQDILDLVSNLKKEVIERKWAEKKALDALDYAESIFESVPSPIVVLDEENKIISANLPFLDLFNLSMARCIRNNIFDLSDNLFNIPSFKELVYRKNEDIKSIELHHEFDLIGYKYLQISSVNLQYNVKHLNFKLVIFNDITELKESQEELRSKNLLLSEIHHRTKNNLFLIEGILQIQLQNLDSENEAKQLMKDNLARIYSITNLHDMLYQAENVEVVDLNQYISRIIQYIESLYSKKVRFFVSIEEVSLKSNKVVELGLILNELVTNCFKYAFSEDEKEPSITIKVYYETKSQELVCKVSDNGKKMKVQKELDIDKTLGFKLIEELVEKKLNGRWDIETESGMVHVIRFPMMEFENTH